MAIPYGDKGLLFFIVREEFCILSRIILACIVNNITAVSLATGERETVKRGIQNGEGKRKSV